MNILSPGTIFVGYGGTPIRPAVRVMSVFFVGAFAFIGTGRVTGTTKVKGVNSNPGVSTRVRLHRDSDGIPVASTVSAAGTGLYTFNNVPFGQSYSVIASYPGYRSVIANGVLAE